MSKRLKIETYVITYVELLLSIQHWITSKRLNIETHVITYV